MRKIAWLPVFLVLFFLVQGSLTSTTVTASYNHGEATVNQTSVGTLASLNVTGQDNIRDIGGKFEVVQFGDHEVSSIWEEITPVTVDTFGETGSISSIYGEDWVYFYITHDTDREWVALQWDADNSSNPGDTIDQMAAGDDMWIFGDTDSGIIGDAKSMGLGGGSLGIGVEADTQDDLFWEKILVNDTEGTTTHVGWEVKRMRTTSDTSGYDQKFSTQFNTTIRFASEAGFHTSGNNIAKFALSSVSLGGAVPIEPTDGGSNQEGEGGKFVRTHIFWGLGIGILTSAFVFIPTYFIVKKEETS